eukprot:TRINITY_DN6563_c0_g1_i1.p1 TRINITY_DN6563_c0_g1~~TRINITY_DN6563_c0_g1_i1.p1  ORF type:complete len:1525 (-),score=339.28 TRINITY_DN6563_c0_g1_i1:254-4828(-)
MRRQPGPYTVAILALFLISLPSSPATRPPSQYCRSPGELTSPEALKVKARGNFEYHPIVSLGKDFTSLSTSFTNWNATQLGDGDRCCQQDGSNSGWKCGIEFTANAGDVIAGVDLGQPYWVNQVLTTWRDPCNSLPRVSYDVMYKNVSNDWALARNRPLSEEPCFYINGDDDGNTAVCLDYFKGVVSQYISLQFNNFLNNPYGGHILELEVHGIPLTKPRTLLSNTTLAPVASDVTVPLDNVFVETGNELGSALGGSDGVTTTVSLTAYRVVTAGADQEVTSSLLAGALSAHTASVSNGYAAFTTLSLLSPSTGSYYLQIDSSGLRPVQVPFTVVPGPPRIIRLFGAPALAVATSNATNASVALSTISDLDSIPLSYDVPVTSSPLKLPDLTLALYDAGGAPASTTLTPITLQAAATADSAGTTTLLDITSLGQYEYQAVTSALVVDLLTVTAPKHGDYYVLAYTNDTSISSTVLMKFRLSAGPAIALLPDNPTSLTFRAAGASALKPISVVAIDASGAIAQPFPPGVVSAASSSLQLSGTLQRTMAGNQVSFTGLSVLRPVVGQHALMFSVTGLSNGTLPITVQPGPGAKLTLKSAPANVVLRADDINALPAMEIEVSDVANNPVPSYPATAVRVNVFRGPDMVPVVATLNGTLTHTTPAGGSGAPVVTFADLALRVPLAGVYTATFTAPGLAALDYSFTVIPGVPERVVHTWADSSKDVPSTRDLQFNTVVARVADVAGNPIPVTYGNASFSNATLTAFDLTARLASSGATASQGIELQGLWDLTPGQTDFQFVMPIAVVGSYDLSIRGASRFDSRILLAPSFDRVHVVLGQPDRFLIRVDLPALYSGDGTAFPNPPELYLVDPSGNELKNINDVPVNAEVIPNVGNRQGDLELTQGGVVIFDSFLFQGRADAEYRVKFFSKDARLTQRWEGFSRVFRTKPCKDVKENTIPDPASGRCVCAPGTHRAPDGSCSQCGSGFYSMGYDNVTLQDITQCLPCPENMDTGSNLMATSAAACECAFGFFRLHANETCSTCPEGAFCPGGSNITATPGFWRGERSSATFYKCQLEEVCPGGEVESCAEGYEGPMCASCVEGYGRLGRRCVTCPKGGLSWALLALWATCLTLCFIWVLQISRADSVPALHGRILLNFIQMALVIAGIPYLWNHRFAELLHALSLVFLLSINFVSADCNFDITYYSELVITAAIPIIGLACALVYNVLHWLITYRYSKDEEKRAEAYYPGVRSDYINEAFRQTLAVWVFVNPAIIRASLRVYTCDQFHDQATLSYDVRIQCGSSEYEHWTLVSSAIFLIYGVGLIAVLGYALWRSRPSSMELLYDSGHLKDRMGFVYAPFRKRFWWWELLMNIFKLGTVCAVANGKEYRDFLLVCFCCLAIIAHISLNPYQSPSLRFNSVNSLLCLYIFFQMSDTFMTTKQKQANDVTSFGDPEDGSILIYYVLHFLCVIVLIFPVIYTIKASIQAVMRRKQAKKMEQDDAARLMEAHSLTLVGEAFEDAILRRELAFRIR